MKISGNVAVRRSHEEVYRKSQSIVGGDWPPMITIGLVRASSKNNSGKYDTNAS